MSEKLCLQWNNFKDYITSSFGSLREDKNFTDVTLACEDGKQVEAHKVILAASSPFFENILRRNKHAHPLIYMRGVKLDDLLAIMDFLYHGEANVYQENLDSFLAIAEELQLKGLMGKSEDVKWAQMDTANIPERDKTIHKEKTNIQISAENSHSEFSEQVLGNELHVVGGSVTIENSYLGDFQLLDEQTKSMMGKTSRRSLRGNLLYICKVCGKEDENSHLKTHIEAKHLEGIILPCKLCEKTFRCKSSLAMHNRRNHNRKYNMI